MTRARELSKLGNANVFTVDSSNNLGIGSLTPDAKLDVVGVVSATKYYGDGSELTGITAGADLSAGSGAQRVVATSLTSGTMTAAATDADLSWNSSTNTLSAPTLSGNITGTAATFTGNVSVGGTLTYDDVTNVDSVGVITARSGIKVGAGESISAVSGTLTYYGDGSNLTGVELGVKNFVASGTISNGATVVINTDGTVGIVTGTVTPAGFGNSSIFLEDSTTTFALTHDTDNNKIVIVYRDTLNNNYAYAKVGTVSGNSISWGTAVEFNDANTESFSITYIGSSKVFITYRDNGNSGYGTGIIGTVSGTSISFGSEYTFTTNEIHEWSSTVYDGTKVVIAYQDNVSPHYGRAVVATVSGTSISYGSLATFESAFVKYGTAVYDSTNNKVVISYQDYANSEYGTAVVGTVSGTNITFGTPVLFNSNGETTYIGSTFDSTNGKVIVTYNDDGNSNYGTVRVGTVSATSISFGTAAVFNTANSTYTFPAYDSANQKVIIVYDDVGNSQYGTLIIGTVSGTDITFGSEVEFNSNGDTEYISSTYDSTNDKLVICYRDGGNSYKMTAKVYSLVSTNQTNLTAENYIGIAGEAISNAATGKISVVGGVNSGQSGLTTAQTYYVGQTGILTTTADTPSVVAGTSISDTKILVWRSYSVTVDGGGSVKFDGSGGSSDYLTVPSSSDLNLSGDFTLEFYYNITSAPNSYIQFTNTSASNAGNFSTETSIYYTVSSGLFAFAADSVSIVTGTVAANDRLNTWTHIAVTRSGSTTRMFINGNLESTSTTVWTAQTGNNWYIGDRPPNAVSAQYPLTGLISNYRIIKGTALYTSNFTVSSSPLTDITNTKLLCCQSETSATDATVTPGTIVATGASASSDNPFS